MHICICVYVYKQAYIHTSTHTTRVICIYIHCICLVFFNIGLVGPHPLQTQLDVIVFMFCSTDAGRPKVGRAEVGRPKVGAGLKPTC